VFWLNASTLFSLDEGYKAIESIAISRGWKGSENDLPILEFLTQQPGGRPLLMVLDQLEDRDTLRSSKVGGVLPIRKRGNPSILMTSRSKKLAAEVAGAGTLHVDYLYVQDAIELLRAGIPQRHLSEDDSKMLVQELSCLPVAIKYVAKYICYEPRITVSACLRILRQRGGFGKVFRLDEDDLRGQFPDLIQSVWESLASQIRAQNPDSLSLMALFCVLGGEINSELLPTLLIQSPGEIARQLATLINYSIV